MTPESSGGCLERVQLEQLAAGVTADSDVSVHLAACMKCQEALAAIQRENELLGEFLGANSDRLEQDERYEQPVEGYEILHELHRGGQGVIYEAEQITTRRTVAIKMMLQGRFATSKQRQRFDREVEIIAGLRHPGIVTLYESGRALGGEVYFAMEFVRGTTLDQWVRALEPSIRERVELFVEVCEAVRYAHGRGIIHRDLKPGNILVDEENNPHVLDFGLARVSNPEGPEAERIATMAGEFLGTFAYAAPEQLEGDPTRIDVRTDVFALGILLYELLAGQRPFDMGSSLADLVRNRIDRVPPPPSEHVEGIDRDLDVICMKALAVDPDRRYGSAGEMEEDLRRHIDGRPILARADSTAYVLGRAVRRHKLPFAVAIGVLLLAIASAIGFAVLFTRAEAARKVAEERLAALTDFIGLFNPYNQGALDMRVSEAIELMDERVESKYQDQPEIASTILTTVGLIHLGFENYDRAHELLQRVMALRADADAKDQGEAHHNLGRLWMDMKDYPLAFAHYNQAYDLRVDTFGRNHPDVLMTLQHLGACKRKQKDFEAAEQYFGQAEEVLVALELTEGEEMATLLNSRAYLEVGRARAAEANNDQVGARSRHQQALSMFRSALAMVRDDIKPNDYRIGRSERSIATQLATLDQHESAVEHYDEAIRILSSKGMESDEVLAIVVDRAKSALILERELDATAAAVRNAATIQEGIAEELDATASWLVAAGTWDLLAEIQEALGRYEEMAGFNNKASDARMRATELARSPEE